MKVRVLIPESLDDITIEQHQKLEVIKNEAKEGMTDEEIRELDNKIISLFTGVEYVESMSEKDRDYFLTSIGKALVTQGEFKDRFEIDGIEFGMIPNFDKITGSEYTDLIKYYNKVEDLHRFFAVAYRPTRLKDVFKNYDIVSYTGTSEMSEIMKKTPMSIVEGFHAFFLTLSNDLGNHIQKCMLEEQMKEMSL